MNKNGICPGLEMRWCESRLRTESSSKGLSKLGRGEATGLTGPEHENLRILYLALFSLYCRLQTLEVSLFCSTQTGTEENMRVEKR